MQTLSLQIRVAQHDDINKISWILSENTKRFLVSDFSEDGKVFFQAEIAPTKLLQKFDDARYQWWVAEKNSVIIGFVVIRDISHLYYLFTHPDYHKQGIANKLWQHILHINAQHALSQITVNASSFALPIYSHFGFIPTAPRQTIKGVNFFPMVYSCQQT